MSYYGHYICISNALYNNDVVHEKNSFVSTPTSKNHYTGLKKSQNQYLLTPNMEKYLSNIQW